MEYGDPALWPEIAKANRATNPYVKFVGQKLKLPAVQSELHKLPGSPAVGVKLQPTPGMRPLPGASQSTNLSPLEATRVARPVLFPTWKYEFEKLKQFRIVRDHPEALYVLQIKGEIKIQKQGALVNIDLSKDGISQQLEVENKTEFNQLTSGIEFKAPLEGKRAEVKCELAIAARVNGQVFLTQKFAMVPPSTLRYTLEPQEIHGEHSGFAFKGKFGYQLEVTPRKNSLPAPQPALVPTARRSDKWIATGLLVGAGALVIATLVEDILTAGAGTADDPISFAAATAMARSALAAS
jgi:hypothetical protein